MVKCDKQVDAIFLEDFIFLPVPIFSRVGKKLLGIGVIFGILWKVILAIGIDLFE